MIHPYEWPDYRLLVTVNNRVTTTTFLLDRVSQDEFFDYWMTLWDDDRSRRITKFDIQPLTKEAYDALVPLYDGKYIVE